MVDRIPGNYGNINKVRRIQNNIAKISKKETPKKDFASILKKALDEVNSIQKQAEKISEDYAAGKINNIHDVIIAAEKASISLRLTTEVTNKIVEAYRTIMRMQL